MNAKLQELKNAIKEKKAEAEKYIDEGKLDEARAAVDELRKLRELYSLSNGLYD